MATPWPSSKENNLEQENRSPSLFTTDLGPLLWNAQRGKPVLLRGFEWVNHVVSGLSDLHSLQKRATVKTPILRVRPFFCFTG
jgi:hypothetical protein